MTQPREVGDFLAKWHGVVARRDLDALGRMLAPGVVLGSPAYWQPLRGHALVHHLLGLILHTIEDFTYHREWQQGPDLALEFTGRVGDHPLQGIDLIRLDDAGLIERLDVLMRPIDTLIALRDVITPRMTQYLTQVASRGSS